MILIVTFAYLVYHDFITKQVDSIAEEYYNHRRINNKTVPKIYDAAHKYLPDFHEYELCNDLYTLIVLLPLVTNFSLFEEYLSFWIIVFLVRSVFNLVTILPKHSSCRIKRGFSVTGSCYDKVFSGHFASIMLAVLLYIKYGWISVPFGVLLVVLSAFFILVTRSHYTVDVLVAIPVTMMIYTMNLRVPI